MKNRIMQLAELRDNTKSVDVGTHEVGHWSNLSGEQISAWARKFYKTKCDIMLRLV